MAEPPAATCIDDDGADVECVWHAGQAGQSQSCDEVCAAVGGVPGGDGQERFCLPESLRAMSQDSSCAIHTEARLMGSQPAWSSCGDCGGVGYANA